GGEIEARQQIEKLLMRRGYGDAELPEVVHELLRRLPGLVRFGGEIGVDEREAGRELIDAAHGVAERGDVARLQSLERVAERCLEGHQAEHEVRELVTRALER